MKKILIATNLLWISLLSIGLSALFSANSYAGQTCYTECPAYEGGTCVTTCY